MTKGRIFGKSYFVVMGILSLIAFFMPDLITIGFFLFIVPGFILSFAPSLLVYPFLIQTAANMFLLNGTTSGRAWLYGFLCVVGLAVVVPMGFNNQLRVTINKFIAQEVHISAPVETPESIALLLSKPQDPAEASKCQKDCARLLHQTSASFVLFGQHADFDTPEKELSGFEKCSAPKDEYCAQPIKRKLQDAQYILLPQRRIAEPQSNSRKWRTPIQTIDAVADEFYKRVNGKFVLRDKRLAIKAHPYLVPLVIGPVDGGGLHVYSRFLEKTFLFNRSTYVSHKATELYDRLFGLPRGSAQQLGLAALSEKFKQGWPATKNIIPEMTTFLENGGNLALPDENGVTLLEYALRGEQVKAVEFLLAHGANSGNKSHNDELVAGTTQYCKVKMLDALLRGGIKVNVAKETNAIAQAFDCSLLERRVKIIEMLLLHGADIDRFGNKPYTALMLAVREGHLSVVSFLLAHKASVNLADADGNTALMHAVTKASYNKNSQDIISLLLEHGADINAKNNKGETAEDLARKSPPHIRDMTLSVMKKSNQ
ncbi:MAG TPA: ankyrin repeat domain-containing protein [Alphaproteobacteria bacterium]|nr:ankyrin repeat domain-containing protein [Alphaproteobacteria bacterium]